MGHGNFYSLKNLIGSPRRKKLVNFAMVYLFLLAIPIDSRAVCTSTSARDGSSTLSSVVNTYYPSVAGSIANAGATSLQVGTPQGSAVAIASGDLLLVIQMQDANCIWTNTDTYGDNVAGAPGSGYNVPNNVGNYEYVTATGAVGGGVVNILGTGTGNGLLHTYTNAVASGTSGQRIYQVISVPQYGSVTLANGLTAFPWNGSVGGVLALDVAYNMNLGGASVTLDGLGFRGGAAQTLAGPAGGDAVGDYRVIATRNNDGAKGEGIAGTPRYLWLLGATALFDNTAEGYPNGSKARGAPGNAGGGGNDADPAANDENTGGGGGGNGTAGG